MTDGSLTEQEWNAIVAEKIARSNAVMAAEELPGKLSAMQIPPAAARVLANSPKNTDARRLLAQSRSRERGAITVLAGPPGTGKTIAAVEWLLLGRAGRFITAAHLARSAREAIPEILAAPLLVVDDLGGEYLDAPGWMSALLEELVNDRMSWDRPTVFTTNLRAKAPAADPGAPCFLSRYGARIVDRMRERGEYLWITGESRRGAE